MKTIVNNITKTDNIPYHCSFVWKRDLCIFRVITNFQFLSLITFVFETNQNIGFYFWIKKIARFSLDYSRKPTVFRLSQGIYIFLKIILFNQIVFFPFSMWKQFYSVLFGLTYTYVNIFTARCSFKPTYMITQLDEAWWRYDKQNWIWLEFSSRKKKMFSIDEVSPISRSSCI